MYVRERQREREMSGDNSNGDSSSSSSDLESVGGLAVHMILSKLGPTGSASVACTGKRFRDWVSEDDPLWSKFCSDELQLQSPQDPFRNPTPTFKGAYQAWRKSFEMYPWPLVTRVKRCWDRMRMWLSTNFPQALATLREGASEDDLNELEDTLKVKLPPPTRVLYRFCDGQELMTAKYSGNMLASPLGLIGGYSFYDKSVNVFLLPLNQVIGETKYVKMLLGFCKRSQYIIVANSSTYHEKIFLLNCAGGKLYVGTQDFATTREMIPCIPCELISSEDGMLLWLEEHVNRLENRIIKTRNEGICRSISLFPEETPFCSTAVTNGVKVRASAVFMPEFSDLKSASRKYFFSYSVRISLLSEGCKIQGQTFDSCQLYWRRWIIRASDDIIQDFDAEAVIGKYPLLLPGGEEFVYESCSPLPSPSGSIEGSFTFVPGRLANPKGSPFEVEVPRFSLHLPDYIF